MINVRNTIWIHPNVVVDLFKGLRKVESYEKIVDNREYYKSREAWIAAMFLLGLTPWDNMNWYLCKNEVENSIIDVYGLPFWEVKGVTYSTNRPLGIQVFRYTHRNSESLLDAIKKKLSGDLRGCSLVCYILRKEKVDWKELNIELKKLAPDLKDISLVGNVSLDHYIVGEVYPEVRNSIINLRDLKPIEARTIAPQQVFEASKTGTVNLGRTTLVTTTLEVIEEPDKKNEE